MARYIGTVKFGEDLSTLQRDLAMRKYIEVYPEQELLAWSDRRVILSDYRSANLG